MRSAPEGYEGPLAEYAALRQELETRSTRQHQLFTAQLTIAGAIFSFALSDSRRTLLLLIVPFVSYLLASRHATQSHNSFMITRYLREDLAYRVPGGLAWDSWVAEQPRLRGPILARLPVVLAFAGVAFLAEAWTVPNLLNAHGLALPRVGLLVLWLVDGALVVGTAMTLTNVVRAYRRWWWPTAALLRQQSPADSSKPEEEGVDPRRSAG